MRRTAMLGLACLLSGCAFVGNPLVSFDQFIGDSHTFTADPNQPIANSTNVLRAKGKPVALPALTPEAGNVWPGPVPPEPTLQQLLQEQNTGPGQENLPFPVTPPTTPTPNVPSLFPNETGRNSQQVPQVLPRGSSSPPPGVAAPPTQAPVIPPPPATPAPQLPTTPTPGSRTFVTPNGRTGTVTPGGNGITTYQVPGGGTGIVVPNGNGTNTLIGPDGSVTTVPATK